MGKSKKAKTEEPKEEAAPGWLEELEPLQERMTELQNTLDKQVTGGLPLRFTPLSHLWHLSDLLTLL
jgi:hypothetical protein